MKTILVLAEHPDFAAAVREGVNPEQCRVVHRPSLEDAEPILAHGLADVCILDVELSTVQGLWIIEKLRRRAPKCPLILFTGADKWEWEEEAYVQGVAHVLAKPVRGRLLSTLLDRLWSGAGQTRSLVSPVAPSAHSPIEPARVVETSTHSSVSQPMRALRDFSGILSHSLNAEGMLKQFLLQMRDLLGVNRAAIFLRQPTSSFGIGPG